MAEKTSDPLAKASKEPDMNEILSEFKVTGSDGTHWNRLRLVEDTRLAKWDTQDDSGKKLARNMPPGKDPFPWEGANDSRVYQSDQIVNELTEASVAGFWLGEVKMVPVGTEDTVASTRATTFINWMIHALMREQLDEEVELSAQYNYWYGWTGLHTSWEREIGYTTREITMDELVENAIDLRRRLDPADIDESTEEGRIISSVAMFPEQVADPDRVDEAIQSAITLYGFFVGQNLPDSVNIEEIKPLGKRDARRIVKELREKGEAMIPFPSLVKNRPCIEALKPWYDLLVPPTSVSLKDSRIIFVRRYYTEAQLRALARDHGWDDDWVDKASATKGKTSIWERNAASVKGVFEWEGRDLQSDLIEVVWAYVRQIDDDSVTGIWMTVFSPHIQDEKMWASHQILNYPPGMYPVTGVSRENLDRSIVTSRGVPEIVLTNQREEKVQRDSLMDLTSMSVIPPLLVPKSAMGQKYKIGPAVQNDVTPGKEPRFMEVPTSGAPLALEYINMVDIKNARYFGLFHPEVPPAVSQLVMRGVVRRFLQGWAVAIRQAYSLCVKFAPEMIEEVTGSRPEPSEQFTVNKFDLIFHFDTIQLDPDLLERKLDAFSKLLPEDSTGTINRSVLTASKARMIDTELARQFVMDQAGANEQLVRQVQTDILMMFAGNPVQLRDASNDPTAPARLQVAAQVVQSNPKYVQALAPEVLGELFGEQAAAQVPQTDNVDPLFSQRMAQYIENLKMGAVQQQNKVVGRTGVTQ